VVLGSMLLYFCTGRCVLLGEVALKSGHERAKASPGAPRGGAGSVATMEGTMTERRTKSAIARVSVIAEQEEGKGGRRTAQREEEPQVR
jgi:hypothetical protein